MLVPRSAFPFLWLSLSLSKCDAFSLDGRCATSSVSVRRAFVEGRATTTTLRVAEVRRSSNDNAAAAAADNEDDDDAVLSDVDAQVLRALLEENTDLATEANLRRILERDAIHRRRRRNGRRAVNDNVVGEDETESTKPEAGTTTTRFVSSLLNDLDRNDGSSSLWNSLTAKMNDFWESTGLYVRNRLERDAKLVAALSAVAFDRIRNEVSRALPEVSTNAQRNAILFLTKSSSAVGESATRLLASTSSSSNDGGDFNNTFDQDDQDDDEFPSNGLAKFAEKLLGSSTDSATTAASRRTLRSIAPSGTASNDERLRRAYAATTSPKRNPVERIALDSYELKRELELERPGYRSESVRRETRNLARSLKASLDVANRLLAPPTIVDPDALRNEQERIANVLKDCLERPRDTWLRDGHDDDDARYDGDALGDAVGAMVTGRDELEELEKETTTTTTETMEAEVERLVRIVNDVVEPAERGAGPEAAALLQDRLMGNDRTVVATAMRLQGKLKYQCVLPPTSAATDSWTADDDNDYVVDATTDFANGFAVTQGEEFAAGTWETPDADKDDPYYFVDADLTESSANGFAVTRDDNDSVGTWIVPEVVDVELEAPTNGVVLVSIEDVDVDVEATTTAAKTTTADVEVLGSDVDVAVDANAVTVHDDDAWGSDDDDEGKKDNLLMDLSLRSVDVTFFLMEKIVVGAPKAVKAGTKLYSRVREARRKGKGYQGWSTLENVRDGKKRY